MRGLLILARREGRDFAGGILHRSIALLSDPGGI